MILHKRIFDHRHNVNQFSPSGTQIRSVSLSSGRSLDNSQKGSKQFCASLFNWVQIFFTSVCPEVELKGLREKIVVFKEKMCNNYKTVL